MVVASEPDPVARAVVAAWGTPEAIGSHLDGAAVRRLGPSTYLVRRPGLHIRDDDLDAAWAGRADLPDPTFLFPSIHRSESGTPALTVHPLGNPGADADVGGTPRTLVPTAPRLMADALRRLAERRPDGYAVTFEATHHGPRLGRPAFFVEISCAPDATPDPTAVRVLADVLPSLAEDPRDRIAVGAGGGHYCPRFTDLALRRRWAFGHLLARHALELLDPATAEAARAATPGAEGVLFATAVDAARPVADRLGPRLSEGASEKRSEYVSGAGARRAPE